MKKVIALIGICNFCIVSLILGQCISGDCQNGFGHKVFEKNNSTCFYIGEFKEGLYDGLGILSIQKVAY